MFLYLELSGVKYLVKWHINSSGERRENDFIFPVIIYSAGAEACDLHVSTSLPNPSSKLSVPRSAIVDFLFHLYTLHSHTHKIYIYIFFFFHQLQNFKRIYCWSYWFLCFGCCVQGDLNAIEPVVFLSKHLQSVSQSARSTESAPEAEFNHERDVLYMPHFALSCFLFFSSPMKSSNFRLGRKHFHNNARSCVKQGTR